MPPRPRLRQGGVHLDWVSDCGQVSGGARGALVGQQKKKDLTIMWVGGPENDLRHGRTRGGLRRYYQRITGRELALKALGQAVCTL